MSSDSTPSPRTPLPDFLVIGAMKAGTTTLYHDLRSQPGVYLPDKESNALLSYDPRRTFSKLFRRVPPGALVGEVCPDYTKAGSDRQAATAAAKLYRDRTVPRIVYLVREPVARLRSHHHFLSSQHGAANPGRMTADLEASLRDFPELVEAGCYASRLKPWVEAFGMKAIRVIRFEDYVADRIGTLRLLSYHLGWEVFDSNAVRTDAVYNAGDSRPVATPFWRKVMGNVIYRRLIRPWLSLERRDRIRERLLPKPPPRSAPPSEETRRRLVETFRPEVEALAEMIGVKEPLWNLDESEA
ncbi:MAG: sulfotransferase domain-containing protein [Verrucomicrobiae bacterium]|nr:sulfotransferase domain-containing protein [Verrucomicrobiae bacterium]